MYGRRSRTSSIIIQLSTLLKNMYVDYVSLLYTVTILYTQFRRYYNIFMSRDFFFISNPTLPNDKTQSRISLKQKIKKYSYIIILRSPSFPINKNGYFYRVPQRCNIDVIFIYIFFIYYPLLEAFTFTSCP